MYSSAVNPTSTRVLLCIAVSYRWYIGAIDIRSAYITATLPSPLTVQKPSGWDPDRSYSLRITRALYGLPQSGLIFFQSLRDNLMSIGFSQSPIDLYVFRRGELANNTLCLLLVNVDDITNYY